MPFRWRSTSGVVLFCLGDAGDRVAALHVVGRHAHALLGRQRQQGLLEARGGVDRHQQAVRAGRVGGPAMEGRIELVQLVAADAGDLGDDLQVDLPAGRDLHEIGLVVDLAELEAVGRRVGHDAPHRQELRHVGAGLGRQLQVPEIDRACPGAVAVHGALHVALAAVVGGDGQQPVAVEVIVQRLQVIERGAGRGDDVAAAVVPPVLLQAEVEPVPGMNCHRPEARARE